MCDLNIHNDNSIVVDTSTSHKELENNSSSNDNLLDSTTTTNTITTTKSNTIQTRNSKGNRLLLPSSSSSSKKLSKQSFHKGKTPIDYPKSSFSSSSSIRRNNLNSTKNYKNITTEKCNQLLSLNMENPTKKSKLKFEFFPLSVSVVKDDRLIFYVCSLCENVCKNYKELNSSCDKSLLTRRCKETEMCYLFRQFVKKVKLEIEEFENTEYGQYIKEKIYLNK